jgi:hypothetical protein
MQTFGLGRIYDMKAGNHALVLRRTDLRLNWALYVGPIGWTTIATFPSLAQSHLTGIGELAILAWLAIAGWAAWDYRAACRAGYRLPVQKVALLGATGFVSIAAWGFATPIVAFAIINLFHAVQYFALVWLKEGDRIAAVLPRAGGSRRIALAAFLLTCGIFGAVYSAIDQKSLLIAPFLACSLLHFWFDSFVWSVRKKQV